MINLEEETEYIKSHTCYEHDGGYGSVDSETEYVTKRDILREAYKILKELKINKYTLEFLDSLIQEKKG